jgi:hypothetical protein
MFSENNLKEISRSQKTTLCNIMNSHFSDKGNGHHNYTKLYYQLFQNKQNLPLKILEIGIGSVNPSIPSNMCGGPLGIYYTPGGSIKGWLDFFPNAEIYCCDVDTDILNFTDDPRVHSFYLDQTNEEQIKSILNNIISNVNFDIIIDDGLHLCPVNFNVMKLLLPNLKRDGYYIIEDIIDREYSYHYIDFESLQNRNYQYVRLPNPDNTIDNNLFIVYPNLT